jgi:hypothetical protein
MSSGARQRDLQLEGESVDGLRKESHRSEKGEKGVDGLTK